MQDVYSHEDPLVTLLVSAAVITLFTLSYLASMAARCRATCHVSRVPPRVTACRRISVEKDWIVAVCGGSCARLSVTNTNVRTIDLAANLLAPLLAGQLLYFCPYYIAALVLIVWVTEQLLSDFECLVRQPLPPQLRQDNPLILVVKLREREGQGVDPGRSLKGHSKVILDGGW